MRYKITIEYDGTNYNGWQKQNNQFSIQTTIEKAISMFSKENVQVVGAGRTDAGVHAIAQVAHFDLEKNMETFRIASAINHYLREEYLSRINCNYLTNIKLKPQDISIINCEIADDNFHARFSAKTRKYRYIIHNSRYPTALNFNRAWQVFMELDVGKMQEAMSHLLCGKTDFTSFRDSNCQAKNPMKTIDSVNLIRNGNEIIFEISAKSFLHHMVRNIVGTLVDVGLGKTSTEDFKKIIEVKDRTKAGPTAPAMGLYFVEVEY